MPAVIAEFVYMILRWLIGTAVVKNVVGKILAAVGLSVISYAGVTVVVGWAVGQIQAEFSSVGSISSLVLTLINVSDLGCIIAAVSGGYTMRWTIKGLTKIGSS